MTVLVEVEIEDEAWSRDIADVEDRVSRAVTATLGDRVGSVVVLLTDDAAVRELNARFRDKDTPTNVLSFPAAPMDLPGQATPLGDLVLAHGVCATEARGQSKTLADHLTHLVVHGTLHLLGHDHMDDAEAEAMEAHEVTILAGLDVADPYRTTP
jgi:probable rRNA maturation factor